MIITIIWKWFCGWSDFPINLISFWEMKSGFDFPTSKYRSHSEACSLYMLNVIHGWSSFNVLCDLILKFSRECLWQSHTNYNAVGCAVSVHTHDTHTTQDIVKYIFFLNKWLKVNEYLFKLIAPPCTSDPACRINMLTRFWLICFFIFHSRYVYYLAHCSGSHAHSHWIKLNLNVFFAEEQHEHWTWTLNTMHRRQLKRRSYE